MLFAFATHCFRNITRSWSRFHQVSERDQAFRLFQGHLILPLAIPGLFLSFALATALFHALRHKNRLSNKFYVLLLNRTFGDLLASFISLSIASFVLLGPTNTNPHIVEFLNIFLLGCFWSSMITYVSIALLKLFGIAYPLKYRHKVTKRTCYRLIQFNWILILTLILLSNFLVALVDVPLLSEWSGCEAETCLYLFVFQTRNGLMAGTYFCTLGCTLLAVLLIARQRPLCPTSAPIQSQSQSPNANPPNSPNRLPLSPLLSGLFTLALFHLPAALHALYLAMFTDKCFYLRHYVLMQKWAGIVRCSLLIRVNLDAALAFCIHRELRTNFWEAFGRGRRKGIGRGRAATISTESRIWRQKKRAAEKRAKSIF